MTFPAEEFPPAKQMPDEAEVAGAELGHQDTPAGQAGESGAELAHEDSAADPAGVAYSPPPAELSSPASTGAGAGAASGNPVDAVADGRWSKIQAMFVDDPHASVAEAASLVDEAIEAFITIVREQQASLASSWQAEDAGTEQLRAAFRDYRTFWTSVTGLSQSA
jgi:hypothetical protein